MLHNRQKRGVDLAYIESFLLYVGIVLAVFAFLFLTFLLIYMVLSFLVLMYKYNDVTYPIYKRHLSYVLKHKVTKFVIFSYFATFIFLYIFKATDYFSEDRAYPQAKAYKIVSDLVLFDFDFFIANRNLYFRPIGLKFIKPYQEIQAYLMKKGFQYIPKDDAERAIWRYEYFFSQYIRARAAPIDFDKLHKDDLGYILRIGGHPTIYKPQAKQMLIEVEQLLDMLMDAPMKDKRYDQVERYMTTILFSQWWEQFSFLHYTLGVRTPHEYSSNAHIDRLMQWTDDPHYLKRLSKLSAWLDKTKEKIDNSKALRQEMKKHKLLYPELMALRVKIASNLTYSNMLNGGKISCDNEYLQKYLTYKTKFVKYAKTDNIYIKLNWQEKWISKSLANNSLEDYLLYSYCGIKKRTLEFDGEIDLDFTSNFNNLSNKVKKILKGFKNGR